MSKHNHEDYGEKDDDDDTNDDNIILWEDLEECELVKIPLSSTTNVMIRQYVSKDDRWGIYSSVWEGGLALLAYFKHLWFQQTLENPNVHNEDSLSNSSIPNVVVDLGSGTGIVGLGLSKMLLEHRKQQQQQQQQRLQPQIRTKQKDMKPRIVPSSSCTKSTTFDCKTILTDLPEALPLLHENIQLNETDTDEQQRLVEDLCIAQELSWGQPISKALHEQLNFSTIHSTNTPNRILLVGADVVYRPTLFPILCQTIMDLFCTYSEVNECILTCHSIRTHLMEFYNYFQSILHSKNNSMLWSMKLLALVQLPDDRVSGVQCSTIQTKETNPNDFPTSLDTAPKTFGLVHVVQIYQQQQQDTTIL